ncbi:hypothetical protein IQK56_16085 [Pseudomonas sp. MAFF 301449]|uniref:DUF3077 domain-containing protein n=1 Tax=Pseudomonas cyclaminis TaxID=2781239 RepID=A0ABR9STV5_9PSED|nr:DUF6124 family protein [Pseudomonas cyclaminis]MBE8592331.1 hypothetical protein [Pseudomonas cyclaminis]MBE8603175.1 hypothetical protein [Pseudomonas cyclaminis]
MIKDSPNPPLDSSLLQNSVHRTLNHYLNPATKADPSAESDSLFAVREGLDAETLLINASEDLASVQALASYLAFEIDGNPRNVALGIHRMLEGIRLLIEKALDQYDPIVAKED